MWNRITTSTVRQTVDLTAVTAINIAATADNNVRPFEHIDMGQAADETAWVPVAMAASHPFWSRDGRLLYYLPTTPTVDIRNKVAAQAFDSRDGQVDPDPIDVLTLSEMIVPAMIT